MEKEHEQGRILQNGFIKSPDSSKAMLEILKEKWCGERLCPICGAKDWRVQYEFELKGEPSKRSNSESYVSLPLVPVMCDECGFTFFMNLYRSLFLNRRDHVSGDEDE